MIQIDKDLTRLDIKFRYKWQAIAYSYILRWWTSLTTRDIIYHEYYVNRNVPAKNWVMTQFLLTKNMEIDKTIK